MPLIPAPKDQWYVVHVLSGQENKVRNSFERRIESEEMGDVIFEVLVPTERVSEVKKGKRSESKRKFFPGYLIVNMHLLNDEKNQSHWDLRNALVNMDNFSGVTGNLSFDEKGEVKRGMKLLTVHRGKIQMLK